jgi:hypothetical protein
MARLNLTLDAETMTALKRHARGGRKATVAREMLREALAARDAQARRRKLARDYAQGREEAKALLEDLEGSQLELLADE